MFLRYVEHDLIILAFTKDKKKWINSIKQIVWKRNKNHIILPFIKSRKEWLKNTHIFSISIGKDVSEIIQ